MKNTERVIGSCALCKQQRELQQSHFVPKALYRLTRSTNTKNAHPVLVTKGCRLQTSYQAVDSLLCTDCEKLFDNNGEDWVMRHCYRGRSKFRLRTILESHAPIAYSSETIIYGAHLVSGVSIEQLVYFCTSVFWRASVQDWWASGQKYEAIKLGDKYQEHIRQYLLGNMGFPENATISVVLSKLNRPPLAFCFPVSYKIESNYTSRFHCHRFHIPGITFMLTIGREIAIEPEESYSCILRSQFHPVFVSKKGDARAQSGILAMMGKHNTSWGTYPIIEGVET